MFNDGISDILVLAWQACSKDRILPLTANYPFIGPHFFGVHGTNPDLWFWNAFFCFILPVSVLCNDLRCYDPRQQFLKHPSFFMAL